VYLANGEEKMSRPFNFWKEECPGSMSRGDVRLPLRLCYHGYTEFRCHLSSIAATLRFHGKRNQVTKFEIKPWKPQNSLGLMQLN